MQRVEDKEIILIHEWFSWSYPDYSEHFCHVANESVRSVYEWKKLLKMGFKKGFSDIFISVPKNGYAGLFLEHKAKRKNGKWGKLTDEQKNFIESKAKIGYYACASFGVDDAICKIREYMS